MHDSDESFQPWLLLIHQLPPKPDYLRVKVRRRLQALGAVALKNTVYVLPNRAETAEDFQWLREEIAAESGDATIVAGSMVGGVTDAEIEELFRAERDGDYAGIARAARAAKSPDEAARLRRRFEDARKTDFFGAPGRVNAERAIAELETKTSGVVPDAAARAGGSATAVRARTWVTREGVFVDRIASAWLIRRFIDPEASFKFVPGKSYRPKSGELRFDMYQGEYTHEGDRCTFETLLRRFALEDDPALGAIAEVVHDVDLKDDKFGRPETAGVAAVLGGLARTYASDADRLEQGAAVFDGLYAQLSDALGSGGASS